MSPDRAPATVCVLGGTGFIGRQLCARLAQRGHFVRVPTRNYARRRSLLVLPQLKLIQCDIHDADALHEVCARSDIVVNLVGILNERGRDGRGFRHAHVELARKVVAACATLGIRRLIQMSALRADASGPSHYLRTKAEAEQVVLAAPELDVTIFRPSLVFGPEDSFINRFARLLRLPSPVFPLPRADARFAPVFVGDVVEAFLRVVEAREGGGERYELCGPKAYTLREILDLIAANLGLRRHILAIPDALARVQARVMDFVPGKPFSSDNFLSLTVDSLCERDGLARLGIGATSLEPWLRARFKGEAPHARYDRYRRYAGR